MPRTITCSTALAVLSLTHLATLAQAQTRDSTLLRPTTVMVRIENDPVAEYNGTYTASGISTKCGLADYGYPHRLSSFAILFPDDPVTGTVTAVNFDADTLASGTTGHSFYLSVGIRVGATGRPPEYVVRANQPQYDEPGTATRTTTAGGVDSLRVVGVASKGTKVTVEMLAVCQP